MQSRLLLVDDDRELGELLKTYLEPYGYQVTLAHDANSMRRECRQHQFDLIILDIMLPDANGLELCQEIRKTSPVSIIMLSAAGDETDRVLGLEMGADDYLPKPFSSRELLARIKSVLRRSQGQLATERQLASLPNYHFLDWRLDLKKHCLINPDGVTIALSHGEYELLLAFVENAGRVLTRDQLLELTRERDASPFDRSIDMQVGRLRKKLNDPPKDPKFIQTVRGGGYQFLPTVSKH
jgi:two-component system, OmpR family, response regulator